MSKASNTAEVPRWKGQEAVGRTVVVHPQFGSVWRNAGRRTWNWRPPDSTGFAAVFHFKTMREAKAHAERVINGL